ncbi:hypothetical protein GCM10022222_69140 [Amycolatopsis ultiminotia]|uniref:PPE family protein n=1 Tax=Amycolatopsis ultiminotia TaxID=543629 RepID=A0ABP6XZB0_9PSEU
MGFFDFIGDAAKAVGHGLEDAADWVGDRASDVGNWFGDLYHGNLGAQAVPSSDLVQKVMASKGAPEWHQGSTQAANLAQKHNDISGRVQQLSANLESVWTGDGADSAQARIRPLSDVSAAASQTFTGNSQNVSGLAHGFDEMKASLQPMPQVPPHKNLVDTAWPWDTDTEKQINDYNEVGQQNLARYQGYAQQAQTSGQGLNIDYGQLADFDGGKVSLSPGQDRAGHRSESDAQSVGKGHGAQGGEVGRSAGAAGSSPGYAGTTTPVSASPSSGAGGSTVVTGSGPGDGTTTSGWTPPSSLPDPSRGSGWVPPSSLPTSGGGNGGGSSWSPGFVGGLGGSNGGLTGGGPGGSGSGAGAGSGGSVGSGGRAGGGARLGAGAGTGAGEEAVARGTAAGGRGTVGARGASGMGGMGAASGKGKGEDDKEHQRKYGVDDDSAFTLVDDEGDRALDPRTGLPPTPPTIGG